MLTQDPEALQYQVRELVPGALATGKNLDSTYFGRFNSLPTVEKIFPGVAVLLNKPGSILDREVGNLHAFFDLFPGQRHRNRRAVVSRAH